MLEEAAKVRATDEDLVREIRSGSEDAFAALVERHKEQAMRVAFSFLKDYEDAKEVSQDAFVKAYRAMPSFKEEARFRTWFYRILMNACRDHQRSQRGWRAWVPWRLDAPKEHSEDPDAETFFVEPAGGATPREEASRGELGTALTRAIDKLPEKQRIAFNLRHLNGLSLEEVAQTMGVSEGTVKAHLFHAARKLRADLDGFLEG